MSVSSGDSGRYSDYADQVAKSFREQLAAMDPNEAEQILALSTEQELIEMARGEWWYVSRPEQVPSPGNWTIHLFMGGRGTGKTQAGSEWLVQRALDHPFDASGFPVDRLVVAYNVSDARTTCIEGSSGIIRVLKRREIPYTYVQSPKPRITLDQTGTRIHFTGADSEDVGRGLNLADVWMDEIIKWGDPGQIWKYGIHPALRANLPNDKPRAFATTTPKPIPILQSWAKRDDGFVSISRGSTFDNASNLSDDFLKEIRDAYEGTTVGRQELYGELIDDLEGPLFSMADIARFRVQEAPGDLGHRVLGVDPSLIGSEDGDWMGVIVAARGQDKHAYILADESIKAAGREAARHIWNVFARYKCDVLAIEVNLGRQWLTAVLKDAYAEMVRDGVFPEFTSPPIKEIFSTHGKKLRAEPVSLRVQQGRIHHVGVFEKLEAQMVSFDPLSSKDSPDRLDAYCHAIRHLMAGEGHTMRIFRPTERVIRGF
jgi:phage terminase large subunit-like protein